MTAEEIRARADALLVEIDSSKNPNTQTLRLAQAVRDLAEVLAGALAAKDEVIAKLIEAKPAQSAPEADPSTSKPRRARTARRK